MEGLWYWKRSAYFVWNCKKIPEQSFFKKNYGSGGRTKMFLKSHNSAHTCRIEKRFSVLCSSSNALSNDTSLTQKIKIKNKNFPSFGDVSQCDVTSRQFQDTYTCCYCCRSCLPNKETCARTPGGTNRSSKITGMTSDQMASWPWFALDRIFKTRSCAIGKMKMKMFQQHPRHFNTSVQFHSYLGHEAFFTKHYGSEHWKFRRIEGTLNLLQTL